MNIAFIIEQQFDPNAGGVQRSTSKLALIFKDNGHKVIIISTHDNKEKKVVWNKIPLYFVDIQSDNNSFKKIFDIEHISIVINQAGYSYKLTKLLKRNLNKKIKLINTLRINPLNFYDNHEFLISDFLKRQGLSFLDTLLTRKIILIYHIFKQRFELNYIIKNVDAFVMLSDRFKPELFRLAPGLKKYKNKVYGINNPFERPKLDINKLNKENIILYVGRLNIIQKRVDLLLQIWQKLHHKLPDWQFWVVGDGPEKEFMEIFCKENSMINVKYFGENKPDGFYKKAKIFHLTSAFEGFGNVLVEAQSYACVPILFNSYSAALDIVTHNENGILISPFDIDDYANATIELINNSTKLNQLKLNGYSNVDRFSYESIYQKWESILDGK